jgi:hypothetical protein
MVYYKPQRHPTKGHPIFHLSISRSNIMPSETPTMPQETHQHMLKQGGNTHMPIQAYEVAWNGKDSRRVTIVRWIAMVAVMAIALVVASK